MKRRDFAKIILSLSPLCLLTAPADKLLRRFYQRFSKIETEGRKTLRTYVMFNMYGAPARWVFDNNFQPHGDDEIHFHPTIFTNYVATNDSAYDAMSTPIEYSTVPFKELHVPSLWKSQVFFRDKLVPMTDLLDNMLSIRGVRQGISSHPVGNVKQICVRSGGLSVSGLAADASQRPIPAVSLGSSPAGNAFTSHQGQVQLEIGYQNSSPENNLIHHLTRSFLKDEKLESDIHPALDIHLPENFDPLLEYKKLVDKYARIIKETRKQCPIPGLTDKPIVVKDFSAPTKEELIFRLNKFVVNGSYMLDADFDLAFADLEIGRNQFLEKQFALAEFVLLHKLSSSLVLAPSKGDEVTVSGIKGLRLVEKENLKIIEEGGQFKVDFASSDPAPRDKIAVYMDSHTSGSFFVVLGSSLFFQSMTACLLELRQTLKDHSTPEDDLFEDVLIHLASEFERGTQRLDGFTDHFGDANPTSFVSGIFKDYKIYGNILVNSTYHANDCTLGEAAEVTEHGGIIQSESILSTITTLLGGPRLSFRHPSLFQIKEGQVVTHLAEPKNIKV